jgi:hypothetical protein
MPSFDFPPLLWWGLPLAAAPLFIHLLNRLRHKRVPFAALEFLLASQNRYRTQVLLRQILLLALRTAAVIGAVLALAQPRWTNGLGGLFGGGRGSHVVLLDDTASMGDRGTTAGMTTAFDRGRAAVSRLVTDLASTPDQEIALGRFSRLVSGTGDAAGRFDLERQPATSQTAARAAGEFGAAGPSAAATSPVAALRSVEPLFAAGTNARQVLWLVSDFRAGDWREADEARAALQRLADAGVAVEFVNCAPPDAAATGGNLAVERLELVGGVPAVGVAASFEVSVRNDGATPAREVQVGLREDGVGRPGVQFTEIPPGETATARFDARFLTPGGHVLEAVLPADRLVTDDTRTAVIDIAERIDVLIVDGDPRGGGRSGDAFYVATALAPGGAAATGLRPRIEPPGRLASLDLAAFDSVWLLDVENLAADEIVALENYAAEGGGVVFFTGPRTRADVVTRSLHRDGAGVFPVPLAGAVDLPPAAGGTAPVPDIIVEDHPVVAVLAGQRNPLLDAVRVDRFLAIDRDFRPPADSGLRRLLSLRSGAALAVERPFGNGLVAAVLTTAAPTWNNWARGNPSWVVVMLELEGHVARARRRTTGLRVGDPFTVSLEAGIDETDVDFSVPPHGTLVRESAQTTGTALAATLPLTAVPGGYAARWRRLDGTAVERLAAVNVDPDEGRLAPVGRDELRRSLSGVPFGFVAADALDPGSGSADGRPLVQQMLLALIAVLLLEQVVAFLAGYHMPAAVRGRTARAAS